MISGTLVKYVIMAAIRDRLILSLFLLIVVGASVSMFLGSAAVIEGDIFAMVFTAGALRLISVIGLVLFVSFFVRRSFDSKDIDYLLSRPISRTCFVLSHMAAFSLLAILLSLLSGVALFAVMPPAFGDGHVLWAFSMMSEFLIIVNVSFFFAMMLSSASSSVMASLAFYMLARIIGQLLGTLDSGVGAGESTLVYYAMKLVSVFVPRFDLMGQTSWLVYGAGDTIGYSFIALQGLLFMGLVATAALMDLSRRQF